MLIKDLRHFQQWPNMKNISLIREENSDDFLCTLVKFEDKVSTSHEKVHENAIIQNENFKELKNDISNQQSWGFSSRQHPEAVARKCFVKNFSLIIWKNSQENTCARVFFKAVASLTLLKIDSSTQVFL